MSALEDMAASSAATADWLEVMSKPLFEYAERLLVIGAIKLAAAATPAGSAHDLIDLAGVLLLFLLTLQLTSRTYAAGSRIYGQLLSFAKPKRRWVKIVATIALTLVALAQGWWLSKEVNRGMNGLADAIVASAR